MAACTPLEWITVGQELLEQAAGRGKRRQKACLRCSYRDYTMRAACTQEPIEGDSFNMSSVEERVKKLICEQLGVKEDEVKEDASFVEDLGADSLDTVELVMALEEEFETEIPDEEAEKITTVKQAIDYILAHQ